VLCRGPAAHVGADLRKHAPAFDIRSPLHRLTGGADLSQIDCIGPQAALQIVAGGQQDEMLRRLRRQSRQEEPNLRGGVDDVS
jgi:hypothetical protein